MGKTERGGRPKVKITCNDEGNSILCYNINGAKDTFQSRLVSLLFQKFRCLRLHIKSMT